MTKEYFYVGYYFDINGKFILKIGTTNDLNRRQKEHTRNYRKAKKYTLPPNEKFYYIWSKALSKYTTLRLEDKVRKRLQECGMGCYVPNDRFAFDTPPDEIDVTIRKTYKIPIV